MPVSRKPRCNAVCDGHKNPHNDNPAPEGATCTLAPGHVERGQGWHLDAMGRKFADVPSPTAPSADQRGRQIEIRGVSMSRAAAENVEETGIDPAEDVASLRDGTHTEASLLADCLDGAEPDREQGWRDYVLAVALAAAVPPRRFVWHLEVEIAEVWVADGFDLTEERAHEIFCHELGWAQGHEIKCKVLKAPDPADVREAQGYPREEKSA